MTIEKDIEEALMRHADDVRAEPGAWNAVDARLRRSYRIRIGLASAAAAALAAAAVVVVPKIVGDTSTRPAPPIVQQSSPSPSPTEQGSGIVPQGWSLLRNDENAFWFALPDSFRVGFFEGHYDYRPSDLPAAATGEDTFFVETTLVTEDYPKPDGPSTESQVGGRTARRYESGIQDSDAHVVTYDLPWPCWAGPGVQTDCQTPRLIVRIFASSQQLWTKFSSIGERMVSFIRHASEATPGGIVRTPHGTITAAVETFDDKTYALIRLMENFVLGDTDIVDSILSADAKRTLQRGEGGLHYYEPGGDYFLMRYQITSRADADANSSNFVVTFFDRKVTGSGSDTEHAAEVGIGPGTDTKGRRRQAVVRFVSPNVS
ncbi:MAG: hypothetical protein ACRDJM_06055 [Actinomycetota bacterium]